MNDKQLVLELLKRLPANVSLRKIAKEIRLLAAIREGKEQADQGQVISHEKIKREFATWIKI